VVALGVLFYMANRPWEDAGPFVLLVMAVDPDVLFQGLIIVRAVFQHVG